MSINEACQVWIEQRIKEELEPGDKSLREIGRVIAAEIEKVFEAKVSPRAIEKKAGRIGATNVAPAENQEPPTVKPVASCSITALVVEKVEQGKTISQASREVAAISGKDPEVVRNSYNRARNRVGDPARASQAFDIVGFAIAQLDRLSKDDPKCEEALLKLESWIQKFREKK